MAGKLAGTAFAEAGVSNVGYQIFCAGCLPSKHDNIAEIRPVWQMCLMTSLFLASALLLAAVSDLPAAAQGSLPKDTAAAREQQWLFRETLGEGQPKPTAVFLSWDYSAVIFLATCDRSSGELVVRNPLQPEDELLQSFTIKIASRAGTVSLRTVLHDRVLEGRTEITSHLVSVLGAQGDLEIDAPNEMGEPIYVGQAEPLRRVALSCR